MFLLILKKELLGHLLDKRLLFGVLLCVSLSLVHIWVLIPEYQSTLEEYDRRASVQSYQVLPATSTRPVTAREVKVELRPAPLGIFAEGVQGKLDRTFRVNGYEEMAGVSNRRDLLFPGLPRLDFAYVVQIVMSLIAVLLTYSTLSGERERGTLRLMLSYAVPRDKILLAKYISAVIVVSGLCAVVFSLEAVAAMGAGFIGLKGEDLARLGLMLLVSVLYISIFALVGLLISCVFRASSAALVAGLFTWAVVIIIVPNLTGMVGSQRRGPTLRNIVAEKEAVIREARKPDWEATKAFMKSEKYKRSVEAKRREREEWIRGGKKGHFNPAIALPGLADRFLQDIRDGLRRLEYSYRNRIDRQIDGCINLSRFSPASSYSLLMSVLAGTGIYDYRRFISDVRRYETLFTRYEWDLREGKGGDPEEIPEFHRTSISFGERLQAGLLDLGLLCIFNILLFLVAFSVFLRYELA